MCRYFPVVKYHGSLRNGQSQPDSPRITSAIALYPEEWLENGLQHLFRHPGALVTHGNHRLATLVFDANLDGCTCRRMPNRIAHNIVQRPCQQAAIARHREISLPAPYQTNLPHLGLNLRLARDLFYHGGQIQRLINSLGRIALGASHLDQFAHQTRQPVAFMLNAVQRPVAILARPRQFHRKPQPVERRTQLVRNILQQPALGGQQGLHAARHVVEGPRRIADLVLPVEARPHIEIPGAKAHHTFPQLAERTRQSHRQGIAQQYNHQHNP